MNSKLSRYPVEFQKILLALPADGRPLELKLPSPSAATAYRMQFYNFLKFCRRNRQETAHFGQRPELITLRVAGSSLICSLRTRSIDAVLDAALNDAAREAGVPIAPVPEEFAPTAPGEVDAGILPPAPESLEPLDGPSPFDLITRHSEENPK